MSDDFTYAVMKKLIAKAMRGRRFESVSEAGIDMITDAAIQYVTDIAEKCARLTANSGRTESNLGDLFKALKLVNEDPLSLANFHGDYTRDAFPFSLDFLIDPFPVRVQTGFYRAQQNDCVMNGFRANSIRSGHREFPYIPESFPRPPGLGTPIVTGLELDRTDSIGISLSASRDRDQQKMKEFLGRFVQRSHSSTEQVMDLTCQLEKPPEIPKRVKEPLSMLGSIPMMDGKMNSTNAENVKALSENGDAISALKENKDLRAALYILFPNLEKKKGK